MKGNDNRNFQFLATDVCTVLSMTKRKRNKRFVSLECTCLLICLCFLLAETLIQGSTAVMILGSVLKLVFQSDKWTE